MLTNIDQGGLRGRNMVNIYNLWGAVHKNIISDRFSTKTAISVHI